MSTDDSKSHKLIPVGIVLSLIGIVTVVGVDGVKRILGIGDELNQGDSLATDENGDTVIGFADGTSIRLGPNGEAILDSDVFDLSAFGEGADISELLQDMQAAILAGLDPSAILDAAAAGELTNSEGNTTHVRVAHDAQAPDAAVSYETDSELGGQGSSGYQVPEGTEALAGIDVFNDGASSDDNPGDDDPGNNDPGNDDPGNSGPSEIFGTTGDDIIHGTGADEIIDGLAGDDLIMGGGGDDTLIGSEGQDILEAKGGDDILLGGKQNDILRGGAGDDLLDGGRGNDLLEGDVGDDELLGGPGNDTLIGGKGNDTLDGGDGADVFKYTDIQDGIDTILDFKPNNGDTIDISELLDGFSTSDPVDNWVQVIENTETADAYDLHVDPTGGGDDFSMLATVHLSGSAGQTTDISDLIDAIVLVNT